MNVDNLLANMRSVSRSLYAKGDTLGGHKAKGNLGEEALIAVVKDYTRFYGGLVFQSVTYPYAELTTGDGFYEGNIKYVDGELMTTDDADINRRISDEVDVVLLTDRRIFLLEAKSYSKAKMTVTPLWTFDNRKKSQANPTGAMEKDIMTQTEKHARHFYQTFWEYIPDGDPSYVIPILVTIDQSTLDNQQTDYPVAKLDNINRIIADYDVQGKWCIDIPAMVEAMRDKCSNITAR